MHVIPFFSYADADFFSHKKAHSTLGELSEAIAFRIRDALEDNNELKAFFDVDDLTNISKEAIYEGIQASSSMLILLNDETLHVSILISHRLSQSCVYMYVTE
jgi:hypothetical protein